MHYLCYDVCCVSITFACLRLFIYVLTSSILGWYLFWSRCSSSCTRCKKTSKCWKAHCGEWIFFITSKYSHIESVYLAWNHGVVVEEQKFIPSCHLLSSNFIHSPLSSSSSIIICSVSQKIINLPSHLHTLKFIYYVQSFWFLCYIM